MLALRGIRSLGQRACLPGTILPTYVYVYVYAYEYVYVYVYVYAYAYAYAYEYVYVYVYVYVISFITSMEVTTKGEGSAVCTPRI